MFPPSAMGKWRCPKERACKKKTSASRKCHVTKNVALALTVVCENWGLMLTLTILHTQKQGDRRWLGWMVNETVAALKILTENERTESFSNLTLCAQNIWNKTYGRLRPERLFPFFPPIRRCGLSNPETLFRNAWQTNKRYNAPKTPLYNVYTHTQTDTIWSTRSQFSTLQEIPLNVRLNEDKADARVIMSSVTVTGGNRLH